MRLFTLPLFSNPPPGFSCLHVQKCTSIFIVLGSDLNHKMITTQKDPPTKCDYTCIHDMVC